MAFVIVQHLSPEFKSLMGELLSRRHTKMALHHVEHGMPLTRADRKAAAQRIVMIRPQWSDRAIAAVGGLSAKTVGAIRRRSTEEIPQSNARLGGDGRVRPLAAADGRS